MTKQTERVISQHFDGSTEDAVRRAKYLVATQRNPPYWATELAGPRGGWKDRETWTMH